MVDTWPPGSTRGFERQVVLRASRTTSLNGDTVIRGHVGVDAPREESFFRNRLITPIYGPSRPASIFFWQMESVPFWVKLNLSLSLSLFPSLRFIWDVKIDLKIEESSVENCVNKSVIEFRDGFLVGEKNFHKIPRGFCREILYWKGWME